jgi:hypothetical protein
VQNATTSRSFSVAARVNLNEGFIAPLDLREERAVQRGGRKL